MKCGWLVPVGAFAQSGNQAARCLGSVMTRAGFSRVIHGLVEECDSGNRSAFSRRVGVSVHTPSRWIRTGTIRIDSLLRLCMRLGLQPVDLLLRNREVRFGPLEVREFPRPTPEVSDQLGPSRDGF